MQWIGGVILIIIGIKFPALGLLMLAIVAIYIFMLSKEMGKEQDSKKSIPKKSIPKKSIPKKSIQKKSIQKKNLKSARVLTQSINELLSESYNLKKTITDIKKLLLSQGYKDFSNDQILLFIDSTENKRPRQKINLNDIKRKITSNKKTMKHQKILKKPKEKKILKKPKEEKKREKFSVDNEISEDLMEKYRRSIK